MSYLELLHLAAPEAIIVFTALVVLSIGLVSGRRRAEASVSVAGLSRVGDTPASATPAVCSFMAGGVGDRCCRHR